MSEPRELNGLQTALVFVAVVMLVALAGFVLLMLMGAVPCAP